MRNGERIAEIPDQYRGAWDYRSVLGSVPVLFEDFSAWILRPPRMFNCANDEIGIAIIKRAMRSRWSTIDWKRAWYISTAQRMAETYQSFGDVENNIQEAMTVINIVMFSHIDRVEPRHQDRLLNILLARKMAGKITLFSVFKEIERIDNSDLQEFLAEAELVS